LIVGLFTRFFAAALAIEMLVALLVVHLPKGYAAGGGGYEYVLLIGAACFLIAIRGGSVFDRPSHRQGTKVAENPQCGGTRPPHCLDQSLVIPA
jgi:hypothetical protein